MKPLTHDSFKKLHFFSLCALAITMPAFETPMQIASILFAIACIGMTFFKRPKLTTFDYLLLAMSAIAILSTLVNWPLVKGLKGIRNNVTLYLLFLGCYHWVPQSAKLKLFARYLFYGAVIGLFLGYIKWISGKTGQLELYSAGTVTQSSVYLAIIYFILLGQYVAKISSDSNDQKKWIFIQCFIVVISLFLMGSRGTLAAFVITHLALIPFLPNRRQLYKILAGCTLFTAILCVFSLNITLPKEVASTNIPPIVYSSVLRIQHIFSQFLEPDQLQEGAEKNDLIRSENWQIALAQIEQGKHPLVGIGPKNYEAIDIDSLSFDTPLQTYPTIWQIPQHAHNLFLTKWCEEGFLGFILFVIFWVLNLFKIFSKKGRYHMRQWWWTAAIGAITMPLIAGSFNSPFYNEFAWLSMILLGLTQGSIKAAHLS